MPKYRVLFCRFPGDFHENPDCTNWLVQTTLAAKADPRIEAVGQWYRSDTPITMTRNLAIQRAREAQADIVVMVDSDMVPDDMLGLDANAKPFWSTAFDFLVNHHGPAMIAAPYLGPPPVENVYIFRWGTKQGNHPNIDLSIDQYSREEATQRTGIEEVAALPTGLCMFHLSAVDRLIPPYFYYEWKKGPKGEDFQSEKASTEDVTFTRDLAFAGVPIYCAWDCWAGHWKRKKVRKPGLISVKDVSKTYLLSLQRHVATGADCPVCGSVDTQKQTEPEKTAPTAEEVKKQIAEAKAEAQTVIAAAQYAKYTEDKGGAVEVLG